MKPSQIHPFMGVVKSGSGEVLVKRGYFTLHAARKSMIDALFKVTDGGDPDVIAEVYRGKQKLSEFSLLVEEHT